MKKAAFVIVLSYLLLFIVLTGPVFVACFGSVFKEQSVVAVYSSWLYWAWIAIMLLSEIALLIVPVKLESWRPVGRRTIWVPIIASGFLMGCLLLGLLVSVVEFFEKHDNRNAGEPWGALWAWLPLWAPLLLWIGWSIVFVRVAKHSSPRDIVSAQCRYLNSGSILTFLVAVPTHIVVRQRHDCCAGFFTFVGIVFGLGVMFLSFGPGVFFLYVDRWKRLHPAVDGPRPQDAESS